jgi:glycosyltransferase involved in cell wall biosynthesis/putative flippase GtrA
MKLLFIANSRIPTERAMGTAIMKQCEAFARAGMQVELVVPLRKNVHIENPFTYHGVEENFTITHLWSLDLPILEYIKARFTVQRVSFFIRLLLYALTDKADFFYTREPELIALLPARKSKFVELHHLYGLGTFGKFFLSRCTGIITITKALREDVARIFDVPPSKMHVAPSGVDLTKFRDGATKEEVRRALGITTTNPIALYIGSLETWKGYETFLKASKFLEDTVSCVVIGGTENQVSTLRQEYPNVFFLGFLPQQLVSRSAQVADVLVAPNSEKELISARHTSPLKVFEYMASGIPIVASAITSIEEILSPKNAVLVEPDNPEALAYGISVVTQDHSLAQSIARQAKEDVVQYTWSVRTEKILGYMRMIVQSKNTNGSQKSSHRRQILTFIVVGIFVALFNIISFAFFEQILKLQYLVASTITFVLTVLVSFLLQKNVTFNNRGHVSRTAKQQLVLYGVNAIFCLFLNWGIMLIGVEYMGASAYVAQVVSMILLAMYNFSVYRWILT